MSRHDPNDPNAWFHARPAEFDPGPIVRANSGQEQRRTNIGKSCADIVRHTAPGDVIPQPPRPEAKRSEAEQDAVDTSTRQTHDKTAALIAAVNSSWSKR